MDANLILKNLIAIATILLICGLYFLTKRWPISIDTTFSQHAATNRQSYVYYIVLFVVTLPLLVIFFGHWFVPTFHVSKMFLLLFFTSCVTQILCTLFPEKGRWRIPHQILAGVSAILLVLCMSMLSTAIAIPLVFQLIFIVGLICMLTIIVITALQGAKLKRKMIFQIVYYVAFFIPVLAITYIS